MIYYICFLQNPTVRVSAGRAAYKAHKALRHRPIMQRPTRPRCDVPRVPDPAPLGPPPAV